MKKIILLILASSLINACSTIAVGTSEITGVSLVHDRRDIQTIALDERIEISASINLNSDDDIRKYTHFNLTSFNRILLITGEVSHADLRTRINNILQKVENVTLVQNQMENANPSSFQTRSYDSLITTKVKTAFSSDKKMPGLDAIRIKVVTENGRVFLMGLVHKKEGEIAAEIAQGVEGVRQVIKVFEYI